MIRKCLYYLIPVVILAACAGRTVTGDGLVFDPSSGKSGSLTMHDGQTVEFTAYEKLFFVTNVEDSTYQYMNVFVPEGATQKTPIFLRTYVGGYMASEASSPQAGDASGRALAEGYVVAIPGSRGRNSKVGETWTGRAPAAILDLKAAIRYLRHFDSVMLGDAEKIITDGVSAGGAMSALMGASGNYPGYEPYLEAMGAAKERDDVFASVCFCPIIDLEHADMAYEWLFKDTDSRLGLPEERKALSAALAAQYPAYLESLHLTKADGSPLKADNYLDYIKELLITAAQKAKDAGADVSADLGFTFNQESRGRFAAPVNGGTPPQESSRPAGGPGENGEFGDASGSSVNYTEYAATLTGTAIPEDLKQRVFLMNPMNFVGDSKATCAPHWYVRHGARDRDTSFPVPVAFATKLKNEGKDVDFLLAWNRPHSGDYALDELFAWIESITK